MVYKPFNWRHSPIYAESNKRNGFDFIEKEEEKKKLKLELEKKFFFPSSSEGHKEVRDWLNINIDRLLLVA